MRTTGISRCAVTGPLMAAGLLAAAEGVGGRCGRAIDPGAAAWNADHSVGRAGRRTGRRPWPATDRGTRRPPGPGPHGGAPGGDRLLSGPRGGVITTATLRDATRWDELVKGLGLSGLVRHGLRHTALTWMADGASTCTSSNASPGTRTRPLPAATCTPTPRRCSTPALPSLRGGPEVVRRNRRSASSVAGSLAHENGPRPA